LKQVDQNFLSVNENGIYCKVGDFYLDPRKPVHKAIISHAHGDHAIAGNLIIYATAQTIEFMKYRHSVKHKTEYRPISIHDSFKIGEVLIQFYEANHMSGSVQILMEYDGVKYLYTGDFKLQNDATCIPFEVVICDVLITESTFANPEVSHPDPVESIKQLTTITHNILLGAYALGKAQRLTKLLNDHCPEKNILIHHSISPLHKIYERQGIDLGKWQFYDRKLMKNPIGNYIYIVPPLTFNSYAYIRNAVRIFASGWENLQKNNDAKLFISDHADWNDLLFLIEKSRAKEVWTIHGNGNYLKKYFQNKDPKVRLFISS